MMNKPNKPPVRRVSVPYTPPKVKPAPASPAKYRRINPNGRAG